MTAKPLSEWLQLMIDEVARKRLDAERAAAEQRARAEDARSAATAARPGIAPTPRSWQRCDSTAR
jgi:hypothetical protein